MGDSLTIRERRGHTSADQIKPRHADDVAAMEFGDEAHGLTVRPALG